MTQDFSKIRAFLDAQERFPIDYIHKVIGKNQSAFLESVLELERRFPQLKRVSVRESASHEHVAITLVLRAESSDHVIRLLEATEGLQELVLVL